MRVRLFLDIGHVMPRPMHIKLTKIKTCMYTLLELKNMMTYLRVKSATATAGPVTDTKLELKMLCLLSPDEVGGI